MAPGDPARLRLRAVVQSRGDGSGIAVPLALAPAARIAERDWDDVLHDPTQLANGLRDLLDAIGPDGLVVTDAGTLLAQAGPAGLRGEHLGAAVEAARRLRASLGDRTVLAAVLPAVPGLLDAGKDLLSAGADVLLVVAVEQAPDDGEVRTLANVSRFHQSLCATLPGAAVTGLPAVEHRGLDDPAPAAGVVVTDVLPRTTDLAVLEDWVAGVRG